MVRVRVRDATCVAVAFSVCTEFTVVTVRNSGYPRGMQSVIRMAALQVEQRRENQFHSSSALFDRNTRAPCRNIVPNSSTSINPSPFKSNKSKTSELPSRSENKEDCVLAFSVWAELMVRAIVRTRKTVC
jgi:hypothetical protein